MYGGLGGGGGWDSPNQITVMITIQLFYCAISKFQSIDLEKRYIQVFIVLAPYLVYCLVIL